jgi:hypothetical protein
MPEQLLLVDLVDTTILDEFLTQVMMIEDKHDGPREELRLLKKRYQAKLPLRAVMTAVKVARAQKKLEDHPKEPTPREEQTVLEQAVHAFLERETLQSSDGVTHITFGGPRRARQG